MAVTGTCWALWYHGMAHLIGIDSQSTQFYAFYSGFGTWILAAAGYTGIIITLVHHLNCHVDGCLRVGKFPVADGQYKVCGKHHREVTGHPKKLTVDFLHHLHHGAS